MTASGSVRVKPDVAHQRLKRRDDFRLGLTHGGKLGGVVRVAVRVSVAGVSSEGKEDGSARRIIGSASISRLMAGSKPARLLRSIPH